MRAGFVYDHRRLHAALTATFVDDQYWQDSNAPSGAGEGVVAAAVPSYQVVDLSAEWRLTEQLTLLGGVNNLLDENYDSRVRGDGIEPAPERTAYAGFRFAF